MKNYLAFYGDYYYPKGVIDDLLGSFDTFEEDKNAIELAHKEKRPDDNKHEFGFGNIYCIETGEKTKLF